VGAPPPGPPGGAGGGGGGGGGGPPPPRLLGRGHGGPAARSRTSSVPLPPRRWVLHIPIPVPSPSRDSERHRRAASLATKRRDVDTSRHRGDRRRHGPQERASLLSLFSCGDTSPGGLCPCMSPTVAWRGAFSRGRAVMAQGKTRQEPPQRKWLLTINYVRHGHKCSNRGLRRVTHAWWRRNGTGKSGLARRSCHVLTRGLTIYDHASTM